MVHKVLQEGHPVVRDESLYDLGLVPMHSFIGDQRGTKSDRVARNLRKNYWP